VVPTAESVAAVAQVIPPLFDSSTSRVAEKVPLIATVLMFALNGRTLSQTQLDPTEEQFVEEAEILPVAEFWANRLPPSTSKSVRTPNSFFI